MNDFFIRRTNCCQHAAELRSRGIAVAGHKVVGAKPGTTLHWYNLRPLEVKPLCFDQTRPVITLEHARGFVEMPDGVVHGAGPVLVRQVAAEEHAAGAPGIAACGGSGVGSTSQV